MNTYTTLTNTVLQTINSNVMETLLAADASYDEAVKIVTEYDYDFAADAASNPVEF